MDYETIQGVTTHFGVAGTAAMRTTAVQVAGFTYSYHVLTTSDTPHHPAKAVDHPVLARVWDNDADTSYDAL